MAQTKPFQVVTGTAIIQKQPFGQLYQHIKQRDPKLHETLDALAKPPQLSSNLSNPLQVLTFGLGSPATGDTTPWATVLSNVPDDQSTYMPLILMGSVRVPSSTDISLDFQVSHDQGANFVSILNSPFIIPATQNVPGPLGLITFAPGTYFRNLDLAYMQFLSAAFDGADINCSLMFQ
jgi:hypothetical protein